MAGEFVLEADGDMLRFFARIADEMVERLGIDRAEAVARINDAWAEVEFEPYPDLVCHEPPGYWALELYYDEVRSWSPLADRSDWEARPLPPAHSPAWTLPRTG
ncbi:hypothetical protein [Kitasatospora viridis]|uniref:Uncharacterized protein n=1 Tax=Kitasatospora viridis TaxID=281105 RepID=A0A561SDX5_9ACTN|nr:hypothetical protein [Kitasatospora viridis]TWF73069.1 hypothetical protein FHX73_16220 [Kitasatospora viridis]